MKVLIIDDHEEYCDLLARAIGAEWPGAVVDRLDPAHRVGLGPSFSADGYDVVLLDHELGGSDGLTLLKAFKKNPDFPPVIYLTAHGDERLAVQAIKTGADDYLPKATVTRKLLVDVMRESLRDRAPRSSTRGGFAQAPGELATGVMVKGYEIKERLARGGSSSVYLARSEKRAETVVVKVLHDLIDPSADGAALERFLREYEAVSALNHPNIVRIYDVGVADDHAFIAMEHLPRGTLKERLRLGAIPERDALALTGKIASALTALHEAHILHRDLKPGNVIMREDDTPVLIDFGLAKHLHLTLSVTEPGKIYGTPYYMSPEQGQGGAIDGRSDLYSLGAMLFEMLTGTKPYTAGTPVALIYKHCHAARPRLPARLRGHQALIDDLMAIDPARRPASAKALSERLKL